MKEKEFAEIYVVEHKGKVMYVGVTTCGLMRRMQHHKHCSKVGSGGAKKLMIWMKVNEDYTARVIEVCRFDGRMEREAFWIAHYGTIKNGLNGSHAGRGGRAKGCWNPSGAEHYMYGQSLSESRRKAISKANKGRSLTPEHVEKIRIANAKPGRKDNRPVIRSDGKEFYGISEAARQHNVTRKAISNAISRNQKSCGHNWKYKEVNI